MAKPEWPQTSSSMKHIVALAFLLTLPLGVLPIRADDGHAAHDLGVEVEELVKSSTQWDGKLMPNYPRKQPQIQILRIKVPAGATLPWHYHPVINAAVVLEGALELKLKSGETKSFKAGDALIEVVNTVHSGRASDDSDVDIVVFYAGTKGEPITVLTPQSNKTSN